MTAAESAFSGIPPIDAFSFGTLNDALDELNNLNTKGTKEFDGNCHRGTGVRSAANCNTNSLREWRNIPQESSRFDVRLLTKENMDTAGSGPFEYESTRITKLGSTRLHRARINPYYHRKPLYSLWGRSSSLNSGVSFSSRLNGCHITNSDYYLRSLRSVNSLPRLYASEEKEIIRMQTTNFQPSSIMFEDQLKRKTEELCSYPIPVPVLTRSKSLEDLRESVKPKLKSLSSDMSSSGSSFDASLSPGRRVTKNCRIGNPTTFPMLYPKRVQENGSSHSSTHRITSREIDSMSLLIGKLDVS